MLDYSTNTASDELRRTNTDTETDWFHKKVTRSRLGVFSEVVDMTPALAKVFLAGNEKNRNVSQNAVQSMVSDMRAGLWVLNGEPIIVSRCGRLNDGQHRLHACIAANVSFPTVVTFGLEFDSRLTTDTGGAKRVRDFLTMEAGIQYAPQAASAARLLLLDRLGLKGNGSAATKVRIRAEYFACQKDIDHAVHVFGSMSAAKHYGTQSVLAAALVILKRTHPLAEEFLIQVVKGTNLTENSPARYAREKLFTDRKMPPLDRIRLLKKTFDAYLEDRPVHFIQLKARKQKKRAA